MASKHNPLILIPTQRQPSANRYALGYDYVHALVRAGANPLLSPVCVDERDLRHVYEIADGVLLAGGPDCDPALFGEAAHEKTSGIDADRDNAELLLTRWAAADDKPIFGICRGMQMMNVAMGGSLIQDIPSQWKTRLQHQGGDWATRDQLLHDVCIEPGSRLAGIVGPGDVGVNSFHHQSVKEVGQGMVVTSRAADGVIESFERPGQRFAIGVQWHPENLVASETCASHTAMLALFQEFVASCGR